MFSITKDFLEFINFEVSKAALLCTLVFPANYISFTLFQNDGTRKTRKQSVSRSEIHCEG